MGGCCLLVNKVPANVMYTDAPELGRSAFLKLRCEEEESRRQSLVRGAFVDSCSSDGIMSALALTRFCNENVHFILLPYSGLEPHQPVKDYGHRQPASLHLLVSSCPPFQAVDLHLVSFPIFSYCDFSVPFHSL